MPVERVRSATDSESDVAGAVRCFLMESFLLSEDELGPDESLIGAGVLDSTGAVELFAFLEEHFDIVLADDDLVPENFDTMTRITRFVEDRLRTTVRHSEASEPVS